MAEKGETKRKLKIGIAIIIILMIIFSLFLFINYYYIRTGKPDDIRITLTNRNKVENLTRIELLLTIENIRDYPIRFDGESSSTFSIKNFNNSISRTQSASSGTPGGVWKANYKEQLLIIITFSTKESNQTQQYRIQYYIKFPEYKVSSNIVYYKTAGIIESLELKYN